MTTSKVIYVAIGIGAILGTAAWLGLTPYLKESVIEKTTIQQVGASSAVGTTFSTQKFAAINFALSSGTSTSILNGDAGDRWVTRLQYICTGVGTSRTAYTGAALASLTLQGATSSSAASATVVLSNTNYIFNTVISTSSAQAFVASSTADTALGSRPEFQLWPSGTYLYIATNATNTASCTGGVQYIGT